jgi:hypothetical protein
MIEIVKVVGVRPVADHRLSVRFSDGTFGEHDFSAMAAERGVMVEPLRDPDYFGRVFIEMGVLAWPNGFDIDAIQLRREMESAGELRRDAVEWGAG